MSGSRTIRVVKRDKSVELFDLGKLTGSLWRALEGTPATYDHACRIAEAIEVHLRRRKHNSVSSTAVFEMLTTALRHIALPKAATAAIRHRQLRQAMRKTLRIRHEGDRLTYWDKGWLVEFACRSWHVSHMTGRIIAGKVEAELLYGTESVVSRQHVVELLNQVMSEFGLADAVPAMP